mmetsp:Transcript_9923/g.21042  ORF Transcript_9923/g.21042 Transcript_9923/m.21042 type:complete len:206 (-) Transcript_9923:1472-2089(-)
MQCISNKVRSQCSQSATADLPSVLGQTARSSLGATPASPTWWLDRDLHRLCLAVSGVAVSAFIHAVHSLHDRLPLHRCPLPFFRSVVQAEGSPRTFPFAARCPHLVASHGFLFISFASRWLYHLAVFHHDVHFPQHQLDLEHQGVNVNAFGAPLQAHATSHKLLHVNPTAAVFVEHVEQVVRIVDVDVEHREVVLHFGVLLPSLL